MAIQIADGFQLRVAKPLDDRQNVETVAQLDPTYGYEGQIVYVKDIKQFYTCYKDEDGSLAYKVMETGSSTSNESAGIELWVSGESYEENDFVSYNDYIYRCKIANNDTDFVEDNWQKQSDTHVEITEQEILDLLDLTDEELETMAHLIDDSAISLNKTYSSSKIYTDIRQCLQDSKDFTLEELGKKIGASYEVVTSTDDMVSQDCLYLLNNGNGYDIYIVDVNNTPVVIEETSIDLSGYVTKTEIESELGTERLGTTSQTVKGAINELFQSVTNNEEDTTDLENRVTTNETNITGLQEQIDNLDIPDITDLENRITTNETNITDLQEQIDNLDIPDITDLENASIMYCDVAEINKAKGTNISLVSGEDNTEKIMNVLAPNEVFANWFNNESAYDRFGINSNLGTRINIISIQKHHNNNGVVIAITNKGKVLSRYMRNNILSNWDYDKTDLPEITNVLTNNSTINQIPNAKLVADEIHGKSISLADYSDALKIPTGKWRVDSTEKAGLMKNLPVSEAGILEVKYLHGNDETTVYTSPYKYAMLTYTVITGDKYERALSSGAAGSITRDTGWRKIINGNSSELTNMNTKLTQLENKANFIPLVADNPTNSYDLNNYKENGNYGIGDSSKYSNLPISRPGLLTVIRSTSYRLQIYTVVNNDDVYFRKSTNGGNSWSSWVLLNGSSGASGNDIYTDTQQECGTWMGKKLYKRSRYSAGTKASITNNTTPVFNVDKTLYTVVKMEGTFRMGPDSSNTTTYQIPFVDFNKSASVILLQDRDGMICMTYKGLSEYKDYGESITVYYTDK